MNSQINLRLPHVMETAARRYAKSHGFGTIQEFIKEVVRERLFGRPEFSQKELDIIRRLAKVTEKRNLYSTEKELMKTLGR